LLYFSPLFSTCSPQSSLVYILFFGSETKIYTNTKHR
jgi:hypothetical protein